MSRYSLLDACNSITKLLIDSGANLNAKAIFRHRLEKMYNEVRTKDVRIRAKEFVLVTPQAREELCELSPIAFEIRKLENREVKAYYLGFPIHYHMPTDEDITKAIDHLNSVGVKTYCEEIRKNNLTYSLRTYIRNSTCFNKKPNRLNKYNVMQEDPYTYSPLDILMMTG